MTPRPLVRDTRCKHVSHTGHHRRQASVTWNGTMTEQLELLAAVQHNCECMTDDNQRCLSACSSHLMLARDQRALNGLLWNRRLVKWLFVQEGISAP
jgi:hypothetical protein